MEPGELVPAQAAEQVSEAVAEMATVIGRYYVELTNNGVPVDVADLIVRDYAGMWADSIFATAGQLRDTE